MTEVSTEPGANLVGGYNGGGCYVLCTNHMLVDGFSRDQNINFPRSLGDQSWNQLDVTVLTCPTSLLTPSFAQKRLPNLPFIAFTQAHCAQNAQLKDTCLGVDFIMTVNISLKL